MYSAAMLRRLLACLALITGLAAGAPAQAEVAAAIAARIEASANATASVSCAIETSAVSPVSYSGSSDAVHGLTAASTVLPYLPVHLGSDRSRE